MLDSPNSNMGYDNRNGVDVKMTYSSIVRKMDKLREVNKIQVFMNLSFRPYDPSFGWDTIDYTIIEVLKGERLTLFTSTSIYEVDRFLEDVLTCEEVFQSV